MSTHLVALLLLPLLQGAATETAGPHQAAKALWEGNTTSCKNCHGIKGEGGFGPVLAGRNLTADQFIESIRKPRWLMPTFPQFSDQEAADFAAYFASLSKVEKPGAWRFEVPPGAPRGQMVALKNVGCAQCHGPALETPRHSAGAVNGDWEWFKHSVYEHTTAVKEFWRQLELRGTPRVRMGDYSTSRLPESVLKEIWNWMNDLGFLVPVMAGFSQGVATADGVTYTLNVENLGQRGKGLVAEDATITLILPAGAEVVSATGEGYQGVRRDEDAKADAAVWQVPCIAPKDRGTYTMTLSRAGTAADNVRGRIRWTTGHGSRTEPETLNIRVGQRPRDIP